jgi:Membrane bound beta barrel domain (DUF5777)
MQKYLLLFCLLPLALFAQDDLLSELEASEKPTLVNSSAFKGTRLVNGHTVETVGRGQLEFIFQHRFGLINGGHYEMFGLDQAFVRLGLDYGLTDNLSVSVGRNSFDKTMDGYAKYKILSQQSGARNVPVTITLLGGAAYKLSPKKEDQPDLENIDRLAYVGQALIARKFTPALSLQLMPTFIHKNAVNKTFEKNDVFALGIGGRLKVSRSIALTTEFYPRFDAPDNDVLKENGLVPHYTAVGFGIDIETGGHVFQLILSNTNTLTERGFITETVGDITEGDLHFGFNVTRGFQLAGRKK